ncbi:MAG: TAXI family TRAP transporter solute-binding subunit [Gemmobacter sp.]
MTIRTVLAGALAGAMLAAPAAAETRVTLKSASSTSSYYVMTVQLAEMLRSESGGAILPTVEESQGSVQNVSEAGRRPGAFLFTSPPNLIDDAFNAREPFNQGGDYSGIRTLFPMPFITIHFVVRADSGIEKVADLEGKTFIAGGTGTFCARQTAAVFDALGLTGKVTTPEMELSGAPAALRNRQADGYATCSSHPTPQVQELAATTAVRILSFSDAEKEAIMAANPAAGAVTIAAGTYAGVDGDVATVAVPVGAYATNMDDATALFIVEQFWAQREGLAGENPWWAGVSPDLVSQLRAPLHPGVVAFYEAQGIAGPAE